MKRVELFRDYVEQIGKRGNSDAFQIKNGFDSFKAISCAEFREDVFNIAASIFKRTGVVEGGEKIAVLGENSYFWVISYMGIVVSGNVVVPVDKELNGSEMENVLKQANVRRLFCSDNYLDVLEDMSEEFVKSLEIINITDCESATYEPLCKLIEQGQQLRKDDEKFGQNENDTMALSTIVFTSGTMGFSKGVMLSRHNILSNVQDTDEFIKLNGKAFSILPMNHTYEFTLGIMLMLFQGVVISINDSIKNLSKNIALFKPTLIVMVPLVAESLIGAIWTKVEDQGKLGSVKKAIKVSNALRKVGIDIRRKLFKPILDGLGGNLEQIFVGGSFLNPKIAEDFDNFGINVNIGYGISECSPFVSGNITHKRKHFSSCGVAINNVQVKIDSPNENGEGEIMVKGESVMMGYYNNVEATNEVLRDGWFATGDIGHIDKAGRIYITGRCKNLIVLNNGKNIYPEEVEFVISNANKDIKEIVVKADNKIGQETTLIAEIYIDSKTLENNPLAKEGVHKSIDAINETLPYFKRIVSVKFRENEFPKTSTKKIKRH